MSAKLVSISEYLSLKTNTYWIYPKNLYLLQYLFLILSIRLMLDMFNLLLVIFYIKQHYMKTFKGPLVLPKIRNNYETWNAALHGTCVAFEKDPPHHIKRTRYVVFVTGRHGPRMSNTQQVKLRHKTPQQRWGYVAGPGTILTGKWRRDGWMDGGEKMGIVRIGSVKSRTGQKLDARCQATNDT